MQDLVRSTGPPGANECGAFDHFHPLSPVYLDLQFSTCPCPFVFSNRSQAVTPPPPRPNPPPGKTQPPRSRRRLHHRDTEAFESEPHDFVPSPDQRTKGLSLLRRNVTLSGDGLSVTRAAVRLHRAPSQVRAQEIIH